MWRVIRIISVLAAAALAMKTPTSLSAETESMARRDDGGCLPLNFEVLAFQIWTPDVHNTAHGFFLYFGFKDNLTMVETVCNQNDTTNTGGPSNDTLRFVCQDPNVQFIWQDGELTLIEQTCPKNPQPSGFEAGGSVTPDLLCAKTTGSDFDLGDGTYCHAEETLIMGNFTSLHPTPPGPARNSGE